MAKVALGKKLPDFRLEGTGGPWRPKDAAGRSLVVYFYPKDATSGCTKEGEAFRDLWPQLKKAGVELVGVSPDPLDSHRRFREKHGFPFELLSDPEHVACTLFDVWKEKSMYGRTYMGVERSTFLFDSQGVLRHEWRKVKVPGHADEVLAAAKAL